MSDEPVQSGPDDSGHDGEHDSTTAAAGERRHSVTRVSTRSDDDPAGDRLLTGILAADATSRRGLLWQRRWLVGGAALGLVVVLVLVLGVRLSAQQAERQAREQASARAAATGFATLVVGRAEDYERPAVAVGRTATDLRTALEDHLVATDRVPGDLDREVATTIRQLEALREELATLTARELPPIDTEVDVEASRLVLVELEQLRVDAGALVEQLDDLVAGAPAWSTAVTRLDAALAAHREVVQDKPETTDPAELAAGWRGELDPLATLRARAEAAAEVPGLAEWAAAHRQYATGTTDFVEEAVALLEGGDLDEYNALYEDTFDVEDPFGFLAAARAGADTALGGPPLTTAAEVVARAELVVEQVATAERAVVTQFGENP